MGLSAFAELVPRLACHAEGRGFEPIIRDRFGKVAYGLAVRVLRDAALAEDAVQEAFLAVWRQAASFDRSRGTASTWILTIVHRRAVDLVRSQTHFNTLPDQLEVTATQAVLAESVDDDVALREARGKVRAALAKLSRAEREVLYLAYWFGLTQSQIARALSIPSGTVKSRTFSALARLREALSQVPELAPSTRRESHVPGGPQVQPCQRIRSAESALVADQICKFA